MARKVVDNFGGGALISPTIAQRNWSSALLVGAMGFGAGALIASALLWRPLPGLPAIDGALADYVSGGIKLGLNKLMPIFFPETAAAMRKQVALLSSQGLLGYLYARAGIAMAVGGAVGFFVGKSALAPVDGLTHTRGRQLVEGKQAVAQAQLEMRNKIKILGGDFYIHPEIQLTREEFSKHMLIFGAIGGGKTTILLPIIKQAIANRDKALIFDVKGDFTSKFGDCALIAPWDKRGQAWLIGRDCDDPQSAIEFAASAISDSKDPMWSAAARQVLVGLIVDLQQRMGANWGWQSLYEQFSRTDENDLIQLMARCNPMALVAVSTANQTTSGILINMTAEMMWIASLAEAWGDPKPGSGGISFIEWLFNDDSEIRQIILQGNGRFEQMMRGYASSIVSMLTARINSPEFNDSRTRRLWFFLDEFPQLGKVKFQPLIEVGRSKGCRVVIGLQDINQVVKVYSKEDADALMSMIGTKIVAQISPGETAKKVAELIGDREVERLNLSHSGSGAGKSTTSMLNRESLKVVYESELSTELGNRPEMGGVVALLITNDSNQVKMLTWPHDNSPTVRPSYVQADWIKGRVVSDEEAYAQSQSQELQEEAKKAPELEAGAGRMNPERARLEREQSEFRRARAAADAKRFEEILGKAKEEPKAPERAPSESTEGSGSKASSAPAAPAGVLAAARASQDSAKATALASEALREMEALAAMAGLNQARAARGPEEEEDENVAIDAADAMHHGEVIGAQMGFGHEGQHAMGLLAMAPVIADAVRSQAPSNDPVEIRRQQMLIERERGRAQSRSWSE